VAKICLILFATTLFLHSVLLLDLLSVIQLDKGASVQKYVESIGDILCRHGVLTKKDVDALKRDFTEGDPTQLDYFLLDEGLASKEELLAALSEHYQIPSFDVRGYQFNHDLLELFPREFLVSHAVMPIDFDGALLTVVVGNPNESGLIEQMQEFTQHHIELHVGITRDIVDEIRAYYEAPPREFDAQEEEEEEEESTEDIVDVF
jgi:hypothetical protein